MARASVTFRFGLADSQAEDFLARTTDPLVIAEVRKELEMPAKKRRQHVTGVIHRVRRGKNLNWSWQHKDSAWKLTELSMELCDARPSYIEANLDAWLKNPGRFCPWKCRAKSEERRKTSSGDT